MTFELTRELADQIIFAMEDQETEYVLDLHELELVPVDEADTDEGDVEQEERFVPLPQWQSVDGYNLMERFIGALHNPEYRERLREILDSGRGVFRQFKNAVKERPEIAALWYRFKEREMRALVVDWYGDVCDFLGLDPVEPEFSETEDLVLSDFGIREATGGELAAGAGRLPDLLELIERQDAAGLEELFDDCPEDYRAYLVGELLRRRPPLRSASSLVLWAEGPAQQLAGFLWAHHRRLKSGLQIGSIEQVYVQGEFRGLGVAGTLIGAYVERAHQRGTQRLLARLPGTAEVLRRLLERTGFEAVSLTMDLDLKQWGRAERL